MIYKSKHTLEEYKELAKRYNIPIYSPYSGTWKQLADKLFDAEEQIAFLSAGNKRYRKAILQETLYLLDEWESWEADMIKDKEVWLDGLPKFTTDVYNGFIELQIKRNAVLKRLRGDNAQK